MQPIYWLILFAVLLAMEVLTMGLTTIWFAGGAIAGMICSLLGGNIWVQMVAFLAVSFVLLLFTRPFALKYINRNRIKTNAEELIGGEAVVTEAIDNLSGNGKVQVKGLEWTARTKNPDQKIASGVTVEILAIEGVKLIVREKEEQK